MTIVAECAGLAIQQIQAVDSPDPEVSGAIFEKGPDVVIAQRRLPARVVAEALDDTAAAVHLIEAPVIGADPQGAAPVLQDLVDLIAAERVSILGRVAEVDERAAIGLPLVEPGCSAHPKGSGSVEHQGIDLIADQ